jgi:amphi-Trp domain-containing protein
MSQIDDFSYDSVQDARTIKDFLKALLDGIEKGRIALSVGESEIVLHPSDLITFSVEARRKGDASELSIRLTWKEGSPLSKFTASDINITS